MIAFSTIRPIKRDETSPSKTRTPKDWKSKQFATVDFRGHREQTEFVRANPSNCYNRKTFFMHRSLVSDEHSMFTKPQPYLPGPPRDFKSTNIKSISQFAPIFNTPTRWGKNAFEDCAISPTNTKEMFRKLTSIPSIAPTSLHFNPINAPNAAPPATKDKQPTTSFPSLAFEQQQQTTLLGDLQSNGLLWDWEELPNPHGGKCYYSRYLHQAKTEKPTMTTLPATWIPLFDNGSQLFYFFNPYTNEAKWEPPKR
jgi:hypothetical protein